MDSDEWLFKHRDDEEWRALIAREIRKTKLLQVALTVGMVISDVLIGVWGAEWFATVPWALCSLGGIYAFTWRTPQPKDESWRRYKKFLGTVFVVSLLASMVIMSENPDFDAPIPGYDDWP